MDQLGYRDHCLDTILQSMKCNSNSGIIPHNWVYKEKFGRVTPQAGFNIIKKCRHFDEILKWARQKALSSFHAKWKTPERPERAAVTDNVV
jgi:hypothetical protein